MSGEESEERAFPPLNITRAAPADLCSTKVTAKRKKTYTLSCVSHQVPLSLSLLPLMIGSDTFKLLCTQIHMSTWA